MKNLVFLLLFFSFSSIQAQNGFSKGKKMMIRAMIGNECLNVDSLMNIRCQVINIHNKPILISAKNIFFKMELVNEKGDTLIPDYNIAHSRDWADKDAYLVAVGDTVTFLSHVQKVKYFNLQPGSRYKCILTYFNGHDKYYGTAKRYYKKKLIKEKIIMEEIYFQTCGK